MNPLLKIKSARKFSVTENLPALISEQLEKRIREQNNLETLQKWHKLTAHSKDIVEFEQLISEPADGAEVKSL